MYFFFQPSVVQLRLLLLIVSKILGNPQAIDEPTSQVNFARLANKLENSVKQKVLVFNCVCTVIVDYSFLSLFCIFKISYVKLYCLGYTYQTKSFIHLSVVR